MQETQIPHRQGLAPGFYMYCCTPGRLPRLPLGACYSEIFSTPLLAVYCFLVFTEMGATSSAGATSTAGATRTGVNLFVSEKRGGKSHFGVILVSAISGT